MRTPAITLSRLPIRPVLVFPVIVVILVLLATAFRISGSSVGVYDYVIDDEPGDGLLSGQPRTVRSDEWAVNTPFVLSQTENGFASFDDNIGSGQDMAVVLDVPYADWSVIFRPQNLPFFVLPAEFAFALKWWSLAALLLLAVYFFVLLIYPKRYLMASLISAGFFLSPFIQWWYQSITLLPIAYSLIAVVIAYRLTISENLRAKLIYAGVLAYVLCCFVLIMYPAFQISAALVAAALFIAVVAGRDRFSWLWRRQNLLLYTGILLVVGLVVGSFILQHRDVISTIQSTVYPGARDVASGGFDPWMIALWPLSYLLLDGGPLTVFGNNQSEISGFLLFGLMALLLVALLYRGLSNFTRLEKLLITAIGAVGLLIAIRLFLPFGSELFALVGMNKVPLVRLILAIGLINLVATIIVAGRLSKPVTTTSWWRDRSIYAAPFIFLVSTFGVWLIDRHFVLDSVGYKETIAVALALSAITVTLTHGTYAVRMVGLGGIILISAATSALANPLYVGLPALDNPFNRVVSAIEKDDRRYWVSDDNPVLSSLLVSSGAEVVGGVNTYPQSWWQEEFPNQDDTFNRYAHIRFDFASRPDKPQLKLIQSDSFRVVLASCDPLVERLNIQYIVSDRTAQLDCFEPIRTVRSGQKVITVFERR